MGSRSVGLRQAARWQAHPARRPHCAWSRERRARLCEELPLSDRQRDGIGTTTARSRSRTSGAQSDPQDRPDTRSSSGRRRSLDEMFRPCSASTTVAPRRHPILRPDEAVRRDGASTLLDPSLLIADELTSALTCRPRRPSPRTAPWSSATASSSERHQSRSRTTSRIYEIVADRTPRHVCSASSSRRPRAAEITQDPKHRYTKLLLGFSLPAGLGVRC